MVYFGYRAHAASVLCHQWAPKAHTLQVEYASCIAPLATTAQAFLEQLQRRRLQHAASSSVTSGPAVLNFDDEVGGRTCKRLPCYAAKFPWCTILSQMANLRTSVERVVHELLVGPHSETKVALLPHLARLAAFAGRRDTADVLLPSLLTFFNSHTWQARALPGCHESPSKANNHLAAPLAGACCLLRFLCWRLPKLGP